MNITGIANLVSRGQDEDRILFDMFVFVLEILQFAAQWLYSGVALNSY